MSVVTCAEYRIEAPGITDAVLKLFERRVWRRRRSPRGREVTDIRPLLIKPLTSSTPDRAEYMCYAGSTQNLRSGCASKAMCETRDMMRSRWLLRRE